MQVSLRKEMEQLHHPSRWCSCCVVSVDLVDQADQADDVADAVTDDNGVLAEVLVHVALVVPQVEPFSRAAEEADLHAGLTLVGGGGDYCGEAIEGSRGAAMLLCEGALVTLDLGEDLLNVHRTSFQ